MCFSCELGLAALKLVCPLVLNKQVRKLWLMRARSLPARKRRYRSERVTPGEPVC